MEPFYDNVGPGANMPVGPLGRQIESKLQAQLASQTLQVKHDQLTVVADSIIRSLPSQRPTNVADRQRQFSKLFEPNKFSAMPRLPQ